MNSDIKKALREVRFVRSYVIACHKQKGSSLIMTCSAYLDVAIKLIKDSMSNV